MQDFIFIAKEFLSNPYAIYIIGAIVLISIIITLVLVLTKKKENLMNRVNYIRKL